MPPRPSRTSAPLGKDPSAAAPWTPGPLGWKDCADPDLAPAFMAEEKATATTVTKVVPAAPALDVEASKFGDRHLDSPPMDPVAAAKFKAILADLRARGVPIRVHEGYRTPARQKDVYASGRTDEQLRAAGYTEPEIKRARRAGFPATAKRSAPNWKSGNSGHGGGLAMDVWWVVKGKGQPAAPYASWRTALAEAVAAHGCEWGGNWTRGPIDRPHVEYFKQTK